MWPKDKLALVFQGLCRCTVTSLSSLQGSHVIILTPAHTFLETQLLRVYSLGLSASLYVTDGCKKREASNIRSLKANIAANFVRRIVFLFAF